MVTRLKLGHAHEHSRVCHLSHAASLNLACITPEMQATACAALRQWFKPLHPGPTAGQWPTRAGRKTGSAHAEAQAAFPASRASPAGCGGCSAASAAGSLQCRQQCNHVLLCRHLNRQPAEHLLIKSEALHLQAQPERADLPLQRKVPSSLLQTPGGRQDGRTTAA